jgi:5'-nucleotidase
VLTRLHLKISRRTRDVTDVRTDNWIVAQDVMRAPDMTALIAHYTSFAAPMRDRVIGRLARAAGRTPDKSGENKIGNLVADAQRAAVGADAAFVNPGSVRVGLPAGDVTFGVAFRAQPFGASLVTMTLSGAQVLDLLKQQWCGRARPLILLPSGVNYVWSRAAVAAATDKPCATAPNPVGNLQIGGAPVDPGRGYRVAVSTLLAYGPDGLTTFRAGTARAGGPTDTEALERFLAPSLTGTPYVPPLRDRITRVP